MANFINRIAKVLFGSVLIAITLTWGDASNMEKLAVLPLVASAFIFSGLFNWQPLYALAEWLIQLSALTRPTGQVALKSLTR
jgi:hypothetical protein